MKRILGITAAALLGASALSVPALAQSDAGSELKKPGAETTMPDVDTGTTAAIDTTWESARAAITGSSATAAAIGSLSAVETVNVVAVTDLEGKDDAEVSKIIEQNQASIDELRTAISANAALSQELETQGVDASSIVGAEVAASGDVTVYTM